MTSISTRRFLQVAGAIAAAAVLVACSKKEEAVAPVAAPTPAPVVKVYNVGTDAAYAPFELMSDKGEIEGFTVDMLKLVASKGGFEVKFINTPWEGIFNSLAQGDRDMLASSITITEERKQTMDFSDSYFDAVQLIAVSGKSKVTKFEDLKKLKVGVQNGTTGDEVVSTALGKTNPNIKRFDSTPLALKELEAGGVDAVVADNGVVIHYVKNNSAGFKTVADPSFAKEQYGFAVKKGNAELLAKINEGLAAARKDGSYDKLHAQYFGEANPAK